MKRILSTLLLLFSTIYIANAQYYTLPTTTGGNPGNLNNDSEFPVGGGIPVGWTTIRTSSATPAWSTSQTLPFSFNFNANPVTAFKVSTSGILSFNLVASPVLPPYGAIALPTSTIPNNSVTITGIAGIGGNDNVVRKTFGVAPNRQLWVSFTSYSDLSGANFFYYAIVLEETTNNIYVVDQRASALIPTSIGVQIDSLNALMIAGSPSLDPQTTNTVDPTPSDNVTYSFAKGPQPDYNLKGLSVNLNKFISQGSKNIAASFSNFGLASITSLDLNYKVDNGPIQTNTITGLLATTFDDFQVTSTIPWIATVGNHTIKVFASNLNGTFTDTIKNNDTAIINLTVLTRDVARIPFYEGFSSSTCPPCAPGNANFKAIMDSVPFESYVSIKLQQDFPGTGDPYTTTETLDRSAYYGINTIPTLQIDGGYDGNSNSFTYQDHLNAKEISAQYDLNGYYNVDTITKTVSGKVAFTPLFNTSSGNVLHVSINENLTTLNVKTNSETEFYHVVKKMVPSSTGTILPPKTAETKDSISFTYTFNGNYRLPINGDAANIIVFSTENSVEQFSDLSVVAWVQGSNKTVFQSKHLTKLTAPSNIKTLVASINTIKVYPNPTTDFINVDINMESTDAATISLYSLNGGVIETINKSLTYGNNNIVFNTQKLQAGNYVVSIVDVKGNSFSKQITIIK